MKLVWSAIVKNESKIIERCVKSILPYVDGAIVVDTGSTDNTPELIKRLFNDAGKPALVSYAPFENFEQARNEALRFARVSMLSWDYLLLVDADMELKAEPGWHNGLTGLSYDMLQTAGSVAYWNRRLVSRQATGKYVGVTHEFLDVESAGQINGAYFIDHTDGSNRPDKFKRDIELLEKALKTERSPGLIQRYNFYLAQSYFDAGDWDSAALRYSMRATMGGYDEEVWNSQYHYAHCLDNQGNRAEFLQEMLKAYEMRPHRSETLYDLAKWFRERGYNYTSLLFSDLGDRKPYPKDDRLFVNTQVHDVGLKEEFSICAYYDKDRRQRGAIACNEVALSRKASAQAANQARFNQFWYLRPLVEHVPSFQPQRIEWTPPEGYAFTNPSVINHKGEPWMIVRAVNYRISTDGRYIVRSTDRPFDNDSPIHTRNYLVCLGVAPAEMIELTPPPDFAPREFDLVTGMEDSRLFEWDDKLWSLSTVRELNPHGWSEMVLAPLVPLLLHTNKCLWGYGDFRKILPPWRRHEKNWMPWVGAGNTLRFVYRLGTLVDTDGKVIERHDNELNIDHICGGSQVVPIDDLTSLAIVHEARTIPGMSIRYYQHRFVKFWNDGSVASISLPFVFFDKQVEFAAGLAYFLETQKLMVSFGVRDEEAWTATMDLHEVLNFFVECR